ncbi:MAG: T9SS type A sorting domain-containing protein, partial [Bacteroidetes bacterium]|nr:T9SS type A sorting domain-containing protein [Bacteroidota bacterium]
YSWDYSTLVPNLQRYEKFDSPLTFPMPFNLLFNIFNTSYGNENNVLTSLPIPGVTLDMAYDFLKESSSKFSQIGAGYTINGAPLPFLYTSNDVIYHFPMNYLNTDSCDYKFGLPIPSVGYYGQKGHRVNEVDGWGTVITPFGTFNALRIKSTIASTDTIELDLVGFGTNITRPLRYEYKWLATAKQIPVLNIMASVVGGVPVVNNVEYIDSLISTVPHLGITENTSENFNSSAFPNPCVETIQVNYFLSEKSTIKISFTDVLGKAVATVLNETQVGGSYQKNINISDLGLSKGVYFLILQTDKNKEVHKIVVGK